MNRAKAVEVLLIRIRKGILSWSEKLPANFVVVFMCGYALPAP